MDYINGRNLYDILKEKRKFREDTVRFIIAQLIIGIGRLHYLNIVHKDLKLENIMLAANGYIKIVDYSLTQILFPSQACTTISTNLDYLAPELTTDQPYENFTKTVDWWSLGILMCELYTGQTPYYASTKS